MRLCPHITCIIKKKRKWLTVAYICTAREICEIPMFMQSFQKNACMGQMGLKIGCLAPPRYQAEPQVLSINQILPVGKSTICRVGAMEKVPLWTLSFHLIPRVLEKIASLLQSWYYLYSTWVSAGEFSGELDCNGVLLSRSITVCWGRVKPQNQCCRTIKKNWPPSASFPPSPVAVQHVSWAWASYHE